jgi:hypothetical protein
LAILNAHFGPFVFTATTTAATFNNARWSIGGGSRLADITTSATTGSQYLGIINDPSWEVDAPLDSTQYPGANALVSSGLALTKIYGAFGSSGTGERVSLTTVESIDFVNDNTNDAVRVVIRGRGGYLTEGVTN